MVRSGYFTPFLLFVAGLGLGIAFAGPLRSQPAKAPKTTAPETGGQLDEWKFPDAESHRSNGKAGNVFVADYATPKPFEEVWAYYAKKIGCKEKYKPNLSFGGIYFAGTDQYQIQILNSTNDPAVAKARRPSAKSATLIRRGAGGNVTVFVSRAKDEDKTHFTLIVEK
jgi:hypothetical protein